MDYIAQPKDYRIAADAITITLNALAEANRIQCSVANDAVITCWINNVAGLDYDSGHQYRSWPLSIVPTYFNTDTNKYVYVAIPKTSTVGTTAVVVFPSEQIDIYGKNSSNTQVGNTNYYYIWIQGIISAVETSDNVSTRQWSQNINNGLLGTDEGRTESVISRIKINGETVPVIDDFINIVTPTKISELNNDVGALDLSDVTGGNGELNVGNKKFVFTHNHDWGDIKNKPNLIEGVTVGGGMISMLLSNGDTVQVDFTPLVNKITSLVNSRGMVIEPLVWSTTYSGTDWTDHEGEYFFDSSVGLLKICTSVAGGTPVFAEVFGKFLVWNNSAGTLQLYTNSGNGMAASVTIFSL